MKDLKNLDTIIYFDFDVDPIEDTECQPDAVDNKFTYHKIKKHAAGRSKQKTLRKIWEVQSGDAPLNDHETLQAHDCYKNLSIKRPNNDGRNLCVFKITSGAKFKSGKLPIICTDGNEQGAFGRSFILMPHRKFKTMVAFDPTEKIPSNVKKGDFTLAACLIDDSKLNGEACTFAFLIDYVDRFNLALPNDPWPGPPHNVVGL